MKQTGFNIVELMTIIFVIFFFISWPVNLWKFTRCDFESPFKCEIFHALGLIPVLSPFTVWIGTDDDNQD